MASFHAVAAVLAAGLWPALAFAAEEPPPPPQIAVMGVLPFGAKLDKRAEVEEAVSEALRPYTRVHATAGVRDVLAGNTRMRASLARGKASLAKGIKAFKRVDSHGAMTMLADAESALLAARCEVYEPAPLVEVYLYMGAAHVMESDPEGATTAFKKLLRLDPEPKLPKGFFAPDVVKVLDKARIWRAGAAPELPDRAALEEILHEVGADLVAVVSRERTGTLDRMLVYLLRPGGEAAKGWATIEGDADLALVAAEAARRAAKAIGLRAAPTDLLPHGDDGAAAADGAPSPALSGDAAPPAKRSVFTRWWFWTGAGVIVAGGVTAVLLVVLLPRP